MPRFLTVSQPKFLMDQKMDLTIALREIKARGAKNVLVQIPEGLKTAVNDIIETIERETGANVAVVMEPCFGACDVADDKAQRLKYDLLVHIGHIEMYAPKIATVFVPVEYEFDLGKKGKLIDDLAKLMKGKKAKSVGIFASAQYMSGIEKLGRLLEEKGFETAYGKGTGRIKKVGQVLGCNYTSLKAIETGVDAFVFLGDGLFHPLGAAFAVSKPVFMIDPIHDEVADLAKAKDKFLRQRFAAIAKAKEAKSFGIIVSTKLGQMQRGVAERCKESIRKAGKKAYTYVLDFVNPEFLIGADVDAYVCTACSRIAVDDYELWNKKPLLNPKELEIVLGLRKWEDYELDELP